MRPSNVRITSSPMTTTDDDVDEMNDVDKEYHKAEAASYVDQFEGPGEYHMDESDSPMTKAGIPPKLSRPNTSASTHNADGTEKEKLQDFYLNEQGHEMYFESPMRRATEEDSDPQMKKKSRRERILARRGAFHWLPVFCSNDLVHGSWWFVWGSILAMIIPGVALADLFFPFWDHTVSSLPILEDAFALGLMVISGLFFTLGSLAFVRALEEPPLKPMFTNYHLCTDELVAAWLFLLATLPYVPFIAVYLYYKNDKGVYWVSLVVSIIFVVATYFFVLSCYPTEDSERDQIIPPIAKALFGERAWVNKHLSNDWLASTWIFYYGTVLLFLGSLFMMLKSWNEFNQLELFDWTSCTVDAFLFLVGSAYFCAGSYPQDAHSTHPQKARDVSETVNEESPLINGGIRPLKKDMNV